MLSSSPCLQGGWGGVISGKILSLSSLGYLSGEGVPIVRLVARGVYLSERGYGVLIYMENMFKPGIKSLGSNLRGVPVAWVPPLGGIVEDL